MNKLDPNSPETPAPLWAVVELMGHVKTGARISTDTQLGTNLIRADVPQADGSFVTQLINSASVYRITFVEEALARACAKSNTAMPFEKWELSHLMPPKEPDALSLLEQEMQHPADHEDDDTPL